MDSQNNRQKFIKNLQFCTDFLIGQVTMTNCLEIGQIGSQFNLTEVDDYINKYLLINFKKIPELTKLPFERLKYLLGSNELENVREIDLFYQVRIELLGQYERRTARLCNSERQLEDF